MRTLFGRASTLGAPAAVGGTAGAAVSAEVAAQVAERDIEVTSGLAASTAEVPKFFFLHASNFPLVAVSKFAGLFILNGECAALHPTVLRQHVRRSLISAMDVTRDLRRLCLERKED